MRCPNCNFEQADLNTECPRCGIVFKKFQNWQNPAPRRRGDSEIKRGTPFRVIASLHEWVLHVEAETNPLYFGGRVLVFLILLAWGWKFIFAPMKANAPGTSFLHLVNLPFHEAGHLFFQIFGQWLGSLGGTLGQLIVPSVCLLVLLLKTRDPFGASVALWWLGESFMDIAPYINDARSQELMLLGGVTGKEAGYGYHDWAFILNEVGLLRWDHTLAHMAHNFGILLMLITFTWAGVLIYRQYQNLHLRSKA